MLTAMRRLAGTWVAKILFVLLVLSFAIWGIEDVVRNFGRETAVARVGGEPIELAEAQMAAQREMGRLARQLGSRFEPDDNIRGRWRRARWSSSSPTAPCAWRRRARAWWRRRMRCGMRFAIEGLRGTDGTFSRLMLDSFLRANGLSEGQFLSLMAGDLLRQQLVGAVRAGAAGPDAMSAPLLSWLMERRSAELVQIRTADMPEPAAPEEAQLRRYQENNPQHFSAPEYREAVIAVLSPEALVGEIEVTDAQLEQGFEQRRGQYETPERRQIVQVVVPNEAAARARSPGRGAMAGSSAPSRRRPRRRMARRPISACWRGPTCPSRRWRRRPSRRPRAASPGRCRARSAGMC